MPQDYYDIDQVLDYLHDRIDNNKGQLGLAYVTYGEEALLPEYPACVLTAERPLQRELHATRQFMVTFNCDLWVFHAKLAVGRRVRNKEDILLAKALRKFIHSDFTLGGHIIFGFVENEVPGTITRVIGQKGTAVVATRLQWTGNNRVRFEDS